jgi:hypothetical protein
MSHKELVNNILTYLSDELSNSSNIAEIDYSTGSSRYIELTIDNGSSKTQAIHIRYSYGFFSSRVKMSVKEYPTPQSGTNPFSSSIFSSLPNHSSPILSYEEWYSYELARKLVNLEKLAKATLEKKANNDTQEGFMKAFRKACPAFEDTLILRDHSKK